MKRWMWILTMIACMGLLLAAPGAAEETPAAAAEEAPAAAAAETEGIFAGAEFTLEDGRYGFLSGMPDGGDWSSHAFHNLYIMDIGDTSYAADGAQGGLYYQFYTFGSDYGMMEEPEKARAFYRDDFAEWVAEYPDGELKEFDIDGHPAAAFLVSDETNEENRASGYGLRVDYARIMYARNAALFVGTIQIWNQEDVSRLTMEDVETYLKHVRYDESLAPITAADAALTLTEKSGAATVTAGKKLSFKASFANPERVSKKNKNDGIVWSVKDAATGEPAANAKIAKGVLTVDKKLEKVTELVVTAASEAYGNSASLTVTAYPALQGVTAEPASLNFYLGATEPQTVKAAMNPDVIPAEGFTWTSSKPAVAEVTDNGDGTAVITAKAAGKATVTVKEPGGKSAKISVTVGEPVTALEVSWKGKAAPGGTVTLTAKLTPARPADKTVEWSTDADGDVAAISAKGQLKIKKGVPDGTVITVVCKALGAPEPLTETVQITVGQ